MSDEKTPSGYPVKINGCGPWWMPNAICFKYFGDECDQHDRDYSSSRKQRKVADKEFMKRMIERIKADEGLGWWAKKARISQAWFFYATVRVVGWSSHRKGLKG